MFSRLLAGAADGTKSEPEVPASVTCPSIILHAGHRKIAGIPVSPILWASTTNWKLSC